MEQQTLLDRAPARSTSHGGSNDGDHERLKHYITKLEWDAAYITGRPATALCGKKWVPTKDPDRFPMCPECQKIWESLPEGPRDDAS